jgi:diguanylate cyclase (GGDEF) domain
VDDNANTLNAYKRLLRKLVKIETAQGVEQGLEIVTKQSPFAVIISDLQMPVMNGIKFLSQVKELTSGSVCMLLTGKADLQSAIDAVNIGIIFRFLIKPCKPDILISAINTGIEMYHSTILDKKQNEKNQILSVTDFLTGCYNRHYLNEHLSNEIKRIKRYKHSLSLVLCDIDHFKKINDSYGHESGDLVLQSFVQCIRENYREDIDWVARYGGEEFVIVLPESDIPRTFYFMERLRHNISQKIFKINSNEITITASFGLAGLGPHTPDEKTSPKFLINTADKFLYQAKKQGRNRVIGA